MDPEVPKKHTIFTPKFIYAGLILAILMTIIITAMVILDIMSKPEIQDQENQKLTQALQDTQNKLQALQDESQQKDKDLQAKISNIKPVINNITKTTDTGNDYSGIVLGWEDRIAKVTCIWYYDNNTVTQVGSSMLISMTEGYAGVVTNKHVLQNNTYVPDYCVVGIYGKGARIVKYEKTNSPYYLDKEDDYGVIFLSSKYEDPSFAASDNGFFDTEAAKNFKVCKPNDAQLGDKVIVLGYPTIGTDKGITATEGIISGNESRYYVTSAKIDHGNSGGAAILVKNNCYLGIPTSAEAGTIESLGRILKTEFVLDDNSLK